MPSLQVKRIWTLCTLCLLPAPLAVVPSSAQGVDYTITDVVDPGDGMTEPEDIDRLEALRQAPIDLNTAGRADLEQLPWITPEQAAAIVERRRRYGLFANITMLRTVPGFDASLIKRLRPFVRVRGAAPPLKGRWRMYHGRREQDGGAGTTGSGLQSELSIGDRLVWGTRIERRNTQPGVKWRAGYVEMRRIARMTRVVAGAYDLQYGRGLVFGRRSIRRIDGLGASVKWRARGIIPARTSGRIGRFIGMMGRTRLRGVSVMTTFADTRTGERVQGGRLSWKGRRVTAGASVAASRSKKDVAGTGGGAPSSRLLSGLDVDAMVGRINLFGEVARSRRGGTGVAAGTHWTAGRLDGGVIFSHIDPSFAVAQVSSGGSARRAHTRWATRLRYRPDARTILVFAYDTLRRPRLLNVRTSARTTTATNVRMRRHLTRSLTLSGLWRRERDDTATRTEEKQWIGQGQFDWRIVRRVRLRNRLERRTRNLSAERTKRRTYRALADLRYRAAGGFTLSAQWTATYGTTIDFLTDDMGDMEENHSDQRRRWAVFMRGPISPGADVSIRYAQTRTIRPGELSILRKDVAWSIQVRMAL